MKQYLNKSGKSAIEYYEIGLDYIIVTFKSGRIRNYLYNYNSTGRVFVENMKVLAENGGGLNSFINKYIKENYDSKW